VAWPVRIKTVGIQCTPFTPILKAIDKLGKKPDEAYTLDECSHSLPILALVSRIYRAYCVSSSFKPSTTTFNTIFCKTKQSVRQSIVMVSELSFIKAYLINIQVSKALSTEVKQAKAVEWFRQSLSAHSFKDLEKQLPAVASVNKMQIKEFVQALTDEGLIRVEKIGGANWYWSFVSDAKKLKEDILSNLTTEEAKLKASIVDIHVQIDEEIAGREDDDEMLKDGNRDRKTLLNAHETLLKEITILTRELAGYSDNDPTEILGRAEETRSLKASAEKWTDYLEGVEGLLKSLTSDKTMVIQLMEKICGDEYVAGEGLKEL